MKKDHTVELKMDADFPTIDECDPPKHPLCAQPPVFV